MSLGKSHCGCSCWALAPFVLVLVFCCLLRCFLWRNASLAGGFAGRRVCGFLWFLFCLFRIACSNGHFLSLYKCLPDSLCSCKDRAFSATSAKLEEKKLGYGIHSDRPPKFEPFQSSQPCLWGRQCRCVGLLLSAPPWPYQNNLPCLPGRHLLTSGRLRVTCQLLHHICLIPLARRDVKI